VKLTLYRKFLLVLVPSFALLGALGIGFVSRHDVREESVLLSTRVGNLAARVALALERHEASGDARLAADFIAAFGADRAIVCVEYDVSQALRKFAAFPPGLGCVGRSAPAKLEVPVGEGGSQKLNVWFSFDEIAEDARRRTAITGSVVAFAFIVTLASASIGFRAIVSRRLSRLHSAIRQTGANGVRQRVTAAGDDELDQIISAYNALVDREERAEQALREANLQLSAESLRDSLTGLANRRHFDVCMAALPEGGAADSRDPSRCAAIYSIDVDHFKKINDTYGHAAGDQVLVELADRLRKALRETDLIVRMGGEELLIYVASMPRADINRFARRTLALANSAPVETGAGPVPVTVSLGVVRLPLKAGADRVPLDRVLKLVDLALYRAKAGGRNRAVAISALAVENLAALVALEGKFDQAELTSRIEFEEIAA
jgi:diguanylate cyclase (GGDEF)-like protein